MELSEFKGWLDSQKITRPITKLQVHHTWLPNYTTRINQDPFKCLEGMRNSHLAKGWSGTGQHLTVFEDGKIAVSLDRTLNKTPAGIYGANTGALCVEIIGNFNVAGDKMTNVQKQAVTHLYACLAIKLNIPIDTSHIVYHAWYTESGTWLGDYVQGKSSKTCPGTLFWGDGNTKAAANKGFIPALKAEVERIKNGGINTEDQKYTLSVTHANAAIDYLKKAWEEATDQPTKDRIGRIADALRVASGQPKVNS
jgi:hypothetical protein